MDWFDADPPRKQIDATLNASLDKLIDAYEAGLREATASFR